MITRRTIPAVPAFLILPIIVILAGSTRSASAEEPVPPYGIVHLAGDLRSAGITVAPERLLKIHEKYLDDFFAARPGIRARFERGGGDQSRYETVTEAQKTIRALRGARSDVEALDIGLFEAIAADIPPEQTQGLQMVRVWRELEVAQARAMAQPGIEWKETPPDVGTFVRTLDLGADERSSVLAMLATSDSTRKGAYDTLVSRCEAARREWAKRAEEIGIAGLNGSQVWAMLYAQEMDDPSMSAWELHRSVRELDASLLAPGSAVAAVVQAQWRAYLDALPLLTHAHQQQLREWVVTSGVFPNIDEPDDSSTDPSRQTPRSVGRRLLALKRLTPEERESIRRDLEEWIRREDSVADKYVRRDVATLRETEGMAVAPGNPQGSRMRASRSQYYAERAKLADEMSRMMALRYGAPWLVDKKAARPADDEKAPLTRADQALLGRAPLAAIENFHEGRDDGYPSGVSQDDWGHKPLGANDLAALTEALQLDDSQQALLTALIERHQEAWKEQVNGRNEACDEIREWIRRGVPAAVKPSSASRATPAGAASARRATFDAASQAMRNFYDEFDAVLDERVDRTPLARFRFARDMEVECRPRTSFDGWHEFLGGRPVNLGAILQKSKLSPASLDAAWRALGRHFSEISAAAQAIDDAILHGERVTDEFMESERIRREQNTRPDLDWRTRRFAYYGAAARDVFGAIELWQVSEAVAMGEILAVVEPREAAELRQAAEHRRFPSAFPEDQFLKRVADDLRKVLARRASAGDSAVDHAPPDADAVAPVLDELSVDTASACLEAIVGAYSSRDESAGWQLADRWREPVALRAGTMDKCFQELRLRRSLDRDASEYRQCLAERMAWSLLMFMPKDLLRESLVTQHLLSSYGLRD